MSDVSLIVYSATDLASAKQFFGQLVGAQPYVDSPQYVGYRCGEMEIGLVPGSGEPAAPIAYWTVEDIDASIKALEDAGGTVVQPLTDVAYGLLVASVREPNGSIVGLRQPPKK